MKTPWTLILTAMIAIAVMLGLTGIPARADEAANVKQADAAANEKIVQSPYEAFSLPVYRQPPM